MVGMTSSLHGDEVNGVRVIHRLFQTELDPESLHGTVVAVVVANVEGFLAGTRGMDGQDLNRLMPGYPARKRLADVAGKRKAQRHNNTVITCFTVWLSIFSISSIYTPLPKDVSIPYTCAPTCSTLVPNAWQCYKIPRYTLVIPPR